MSVADKIFNFATGSTCCSSSGRAMARLYLVLQGWPLPIGATTIALDDTRIGWWSQAMVEYVRGEWRGSHRDAEQIGRQHPEIWALAQAAQAAIA